MADPIIETRTPEQLPRVTSISPDALVTVQEEGGPVASMAIKQLLGRLIQTDTAKETEADLLADLDHGDSAVALVFADPNPAKNGWYRKTGASGGGTWTQFEKLSAFAAAEIAEYVDQASDSADTALAAADAALALTNFRATRDEAVADFEVGTYFASAESGDLRIYRRVAGMPGYVDQGDAAAPVSAALIDRTVPQTPLRFGALGIDGDDTNALLDWATSGEKLAMPVGDYSFRSEAPIVLSIPGTVIDAGNSRSRIALGQRNAGRGLVETTGDDCTIKGLRLINPDMLKATSGSQQHAVLCRANGTRLEGLRVQDFEMGLTTTAGADPTGTPAEGEFFNTWYLYNIIRILGVGGGTPDPADGFGEDRGDGITHWGGRAWAIANYIAALDNTDCRGFIFFEGLGDFALDNSGYDNKAIGFISQNYCGRAAGIANGGGRGRRGIDIEDFMRALVSLNIVSSSAWFAFQAAGNCSHSSFVQNFAFMDCPDDNANGASWTPNHAAYHFYPNGTAATDVLFDGNRSYHTTAKHRAFVLNGTSNSAPKDIVVRNHRAIAAPGLDMGTRDAFICADFSAGAEIGLENIKVRGDWNRGLYAAAVPTLRLTGDNFFEGTDDFAGSIQNVTQLTIDGFTARDCDHGLELANIASGDIRNVTMNSIAGLWIATFGTNSLGFENLTAIGGTGLVSQFGTDTITRWKNAPTFSFMRGVLNTTPAAIPAGAVGGGVDVTVPGIADTDRLTATWGGPDQIGPIAHKKAANTVRVAFADLTGAGVTPGGAGDITVYAERG